MLWNEGHDVVLIEELGKLQAENGELPQTAIDNNAILITFDKHFTNLKRDIQRQARLIYIKMKYRDPVIVEKIL